MLITFCCLLFVPHWAIFVQRWKKEYIFYEKEAMYKVLDVHNTQVQMHSAVDISSF